MAKQTPTSRFEIFEPGRYTETYIEFFTRDDDGPVYILQEWGGREQLVARYNTFDAEGNEGPPGSIREDELPLFVHAFGVDPSRLPKDPLQALAAAERLIKESSKEVAVTVTESKGDQNWIRWIDGMELPKGKYHFGFESVRDWYTTEYGTFCNISLKVLCNADGIPSPLAGCITQMSVRRESFSVMRALAPKGMEKFLGLEDDELIALGTLAAEEDSRIYGEVGVPPNGTRPKILTYTLRPVQEGEEIEPTTTTGTDEELEVSHTEYLYQAINDGVAESGMGEKGVIDGSLSNAGKAWCKANFTEVCKLHDIPRDITLVTTEKQALHMLIAVGRDDLVDKIMGEEEDTGGDSW